MWTNTTFTFLVDDLAYEQIDLTADDKYNSFRDPTNPFFFIINLALGGDFPHYSPTDGFPAHFEIDWVRVWQQTDSGGLLKRPLQWVEEERRVMDEGVERMQADKSRDGSRYMGRKRLDDAKVVKME